ncbi:MAG: hypothetical protein SGI87_12500 [Flavobacteriales bacterium]|nr:hypothetical protein [Flavobacteriales bacterium]
MIVISQQPEPESFDDVVRKKGLKFLRDNEPPYNWTYHAYWRDSLPDLCRAYRSICAYCCHWIPNEQGSASVDHFIPKSITPDLAYEWANFRLASSKMNAKKRDYTDVVDPFEIQADTFILLFPAMLVKPNPRFSGAEKKSLWDTIKRLDLNADESLVKARLRWVLDYCDGHISFAYLQGKAPFIAAEIQRQGLLASLQILFARRSII